MRLQHRLQGAFRLAALGLCLCPRLARADIPVGYKGTPFMGTPQVVPGRLELENFDDGGPGVGYQHHVGTAASGAGYRPGDQPPICATNVLSMDKTVDGGPYPTIGDPKSYYVCQCHAGEWLSFTIDVKQAGMYVVNTTFATTDANIDVNLESNGIDKTGSVKVVGTHDYHIWKTYDGLTRLQLAAGVQVLKFTTNNAGLQQDYLDFALEGASGDGGAPPTADAAGPADATGTVTSDAADGAAATGSTTGAAGSTSGTTGSGGTAGVTGAGGTSAAGQGGAVGAPAASGGAGTTGASGAPSHGGGGCWLGARDEGAPRTRVSWLLLGTVSVWLAGRGRRRAPRRRP